MRSNRYGILTVTMKLKVSINLTVGRFVKRFIMADMALFAGWGMLDPVFSIFIIREIPGATIVTVGTAVAIYWLLKSAIQIPIANALDKENTENHAFLSLVGSLVLVGVTAIAFLAATEIWHIYILQVLKAIAFGVYVPAWSGLFSKHLDKGHYSLDWSLDSTSVGLVTGVTGFLGGVIVAYFGYGMVFILAGIFAFLAAGVTATLPKIILPHGTHHKGIIKDHTPLNINQ